MTTRRKVYRWVPTGEAFPCTCGVGRVRRYQVDPPRTTYLNVVWVCDNAACEESENRRGEKGRLILA